MRKTLQISDGTVGPWPIASGQNDLQSVQRCLYHTRQPQATSEQQTSAASAGVGSPGKPVEKKKKKMFEFKLASLFLKVTAAAGPQLRRHLGQESVIQVQTELNVA